jgi:hypothetical protein
MILPSTALEKGGWVAEHIGFLVHPKQLDIENVVVAADYSDPDGGNFHLGQQVDS